MKYFAVFAMFLALSAVGGGRSVASDASGTMSIVNAFLDAFNKADTKGIAATCTSPAFVLDDFPPHTWSGATACGDWANAFVAFAKAQVFTDNAVTVGKPLYDAVTGDRAYVVLDATYTYKDHGKPVKEAGVWTLVLKKTAAGWRIAAWAWADH
jgi:ketosteroid isomerase-like protein